MSRINDLGGIHGFGPITPQAGEPVFHAEWEGRILAIQRALGYTRSWHIDQFRDAQERLPPPLYLSLSYYERWLLGLERNCVEAGLVTEDELATGRSLHPPKPVTRSLRIADVDAVFSRGAYGRPIIRDARFAPGDRVRARNLTLRRIRGCRVTRTAVQERWKRCAVSTSIRTRWSQDRGRIRSGSIPWSSMPGNSGGREAPIRA